MSPLSDPVDTVLGIWYLVSGWLCPGMYKECSGPILVYTEPDRPILMIIFPLINVMV